ncbi:hypothetical protein [Acetobacter fabarum]|uniref:Uncharacterized protein n=1 Tax=Acetobacter fabarum TaxID=483199 RepID=A0A269XYB2_9PROT|nr:hypothetical protein [Acetobacter fabarum]PAK78219.1 hypothetical protein B8X00_07575 [Acetobacter fabarum]PEN25411.1 hypothetical protein CRM93_09475 [Acetobacter fabarum]
MTAQDRNSGEDTPQPQERAKATSLFQTEATLSTAMRAPPQMRGGRMPLFVLEDAPQGLAWRGKGGVVFAGIAPEPAQTQGWRCVLEWSGPEGGATHGGHCLCCVGRGGLDQFLLAQAQSRVRGVGEPLEVMVVVCAPQLVAAYKTQLKTSVFLSAFYALQA